MSNKILLQRNKFGLCSPHLLDTYPFPNSKAPLPFQHERCETLAEALPHLFPRRMDRHELRMK